MNHLIQRIIEHPAVGAAGTMADNEALKALRKLGNTGVASPGLTGSFSSMPHESPARESLLVAYGLRTLCLPADLALLGRVHTI